MNISGMDLNLFQVLHAVLKEKSATRAARRLNVTQSAVSNALTRLRRLLNDPLVVRNGRGLIPTPHAIELYPLVESAMAQLQSALDQQHDADPARVTRRFTLACSDSSQVHDVCKVVEALSHRMPRASLRVASMGYVIACDGLETGEVDALLGSRQSAKGFHWTKLYQDDAVLVVRQNTLSLPKRISREIFDTLQHIDTTITTGQGTYMQKPYLPFLNTNRPDRRVVLTVPTFTAAAIVVARTNYAATIPRRVATALREYLPLKIIEIPFQESKLEVVLIWHARTHADPAARHFRETIIAALRA